MLIQRFIHSFHRLQWKLTFSYMLTTVVMFLVIEIIITTIILWFVGNNAAHVVVSNAQQQAQQATPFFVHGKPDQEEVTVWLQTLESEAGSANAFFDYRQGSSFLTIVNAQGRVIASVGGQPTTPGIMIQTQLPMRDAANLHTVLTEGTDTASQVDLGANGTAVVIVPIVGKDRQVQGALVRKEILPNTWQLFLFFLPIILRSILVITLLVAIPGAIFGFVTARNFTKRLKRLAVAADNWSRGDFSAFAYDTSRDELGQLTRQFNRMAEHLQNLLEARQKLATLEERNRLARDLHDSVKQQVFAIAMQIGAAKVLLGRDIAAAQTRLNEAEKLVHQAQQELTTLIRELRPVALEGKGLVVALRELATQWTQQTNIVANLWVEGQETLPLAVEEALFRVAQEALANVARHSNATLVQMRLINEEDGVTLTVADNGEGFDMAKRDNRGVGLLSMQERMKALGGEVHIESTPGKGTQVIARCEKQGTIQMQPETPLARG